VREIAWICLGETIRLIIVRCSTISIVDALTIFFKCSESSLWYDSLSKLCGRYLSAHKLMFVLFCTAHKFGRVSSRSLVKKSLYHVHKNVNQPKPALLPSHRLSLALAAFPKNGRRTCSFTWLWA
jgi:hypothetical protein